MSPSSSPPSSPPSRSHRSHRAVGAGRARAAFGAVLGAALATAAWAAPAAAPAVPATPFVPAPPPGLSCPIPGRINAADGSLTGFSPAPQIYLEVDAKETPAEIYRTPGRAILVISPQLPSPVVLSATVVALVPQAGIDRHPDGTLDVRRDAKLKRLGTYQVEDDKKLSFSIGGHSQVLQLRPPLDFLRAPAATPSQPRR